MREYKICVRKEKEPLVLSPPLIRTLVEKVQKSGKKHLTIPAEEILPPEYLRYLIRVLNANAAEDAKEARSGDVYELTARQIKNLLLQETSEDDERTSACFDEAEAGKVFLLETGERFFFLAHQSGLRFVCAYEGGGEIGIVDLKLDII